MKRGGSFNLTFRVKAEFRERATLRKVNIKHIHMRVFQKSCFLQSDYSSLHFNANIWLTYLNILYTDGKQMTLRWHFLSSPQLPENIFYKCWLDFQDMLHRSDNLKVKLENVLLNMAFGNHDFGLLFNFSIKDFPKIIFPLKSFTLFQISGEINVKWFFVYLSWWL